MATTISTKTSDLQIGDFIKVGNSIDGFTSWTILQIGINHKNIIDVKVKTQDGKILITSAHANSQWQVVPTITFSWSANTLVKAGA